MLGSFLLFSMSIETNTSSNGTNFLCFRNDAFGEKHEARQPLFYSPNFFTFSVSGYRSIAPRKSQRADKLQLKIYLFTISRTGSPVRPFSYLAIFQCQKTQQFILCLVDFCTPYLYFSVPYRPMLLRLRRKKAKTKFGGCSK